MIVGIVVLVTVPVAVFAAIRAVGSALPRPDGTGPANQVLEARLRRMEEAIDAMAVEIERLRTREAGRYVSGERAEPRQLPSPDDPPTFR